jgi:hypothetical protein
MRRTTFDAAVDTARAVTALVQTAVLFHVRGRRAVARATLGAGEIPAAAPASLPPHHATIRRAHRAVQRATRAWPVDVQCLQAALVLHRVLRARQVYSTLRIGVRFDGGELKAHAWVEVDGCRLDGAPNADNGFIPLESPDRTAGMVPA